MEIITSRNNKRIKEAALIGSKDKSRFLIEGFHNVEMASAAGILETVFSVKEISYSNVETVLVSSECIDRLASTKTPEGIIGVCKKLESKEISNNKVIFLDNVQDPGNVGAILRTALAFGYKDIIVTEGCASIYNSKTLLASQGSIFHLNIAKGDLETLNKLQNNGYQIVSTCLKDSIELPTLKEVPSKVVMVFGNEGKGIREEIINLSNIKIRIPIENIDSLNVSVAAGILLYQFKD